MTLRTALLAGIAPFAHLAGRPVPAASPAPGARPPAAGAAVAPAAAPPPAPAAAAAGAASPAAGAAAGEDGEEDMSGAGAEGEDGKGKGKAKAKPKRRANKEGDGEDGEDEDEEGDDASDEEDDEDEGKRAARSRERARCAAIFADPAAAANVPLAATLAFTTHLPRSQAVAALRAGVAGQPAAAVPARGRSIDARMQDAPATAVGDAGGPAPDTADGMVASILAARSKATGKT